VIGGTVNQSGASGASSADKIGRDTMLSRIVDMVAKAQRSRAPIQRHCGQGRWLVRADGDGVPRCSPSSAWSDVRAGAALHLCDWWPLSPC
jgi:hypothetical protein